MSQKQQVYLYDEYYLPYAYRSFGRHQVDFQERVNMERMRKERLEKFRAQMSQAGVSVMLLLAPHNMRYTVAYTHLTYAVGNAYVLLPLEGDPIVFGHTCSALQDRRNMPWLKPENVRFYMIAAIGSMVSGNPPFDQALSERFGQQMKGALKEMKLDKEVLALDIPDPRAQAALERVGIRTSVRPDIALKAQEIKTQDEIECFRICASICDIAHYELAKYAEPGKSELELAGYMNFRGMAYGCEPVPNSFVASGQFSHPNYRYSTDRILRPGDIFVADTIQFSWNGYKSCCYRTYSVVTPPSQAARDAMKRMIDAVDEALSQCKPGNTTADMMKNFPEWGEPPGHGGGNAMHGLGLVNYGPPWGLNPFSLQYPQVLKEGHVFAIEPEMGIGDGQGVRLEEMVVVTKTGCEVLNHAPCEIVTVPLR